MEASVTHALLQVERWTVGSILDAATTRLAERGFDESRLHAEYLLSRVLAIPRLTLSMHPARVLSRDEVAVFAALYDRRLAHEPLQYILGDTEFMGLTLQVDRSVFIPRPETELLVEKALEVMATPGETELSVLDIGTGSGNVALAIARFEPRSAVTSIDVSPDALATASANAARAGIPNVRFERKDIFSNVFQGDLFDIIVSNPPYVPAEDFLQLEPEVRDFEPTIAVTDGVDGLRFARRIGMFAARHLRPGAWVAMEIGWGQSEEVRTIMTDAGFGLIEALNDHAGIPRVVRARKGSVRSAGVGA